MAASFILQILFSFGILTYSSVGFHSQGFCTSSRRLLDNNWNSPKLVGTVSCRFLYESIYETTGTSCHPRKCALYSKKLSQVEDDGYSLSRSKSFLREITKRIFPQKPPGNLILIRHGESDLNYNKTFTGWIDADLNERGVREVEYAARLLLERGYTVDTVYTSRLKRAIKSTWIILRELNQIYRPVFKSWRLNERMYGSLEGTSKMDAVLDMGEEKVQDFRVGLTGRPPIMTPQHPHWHKTERKYADLDQDEIPVSESLWDTMQRTIPLLESRILPELRDGKTVMIVAHANSLRGIVKHLEKLDPSKIKAVGIPNGIPLVYKFDRRMVPIKLNGAVPPLSCEFLEKKVQVLPVYYTNTGILSDKLCGLMFLSGALATSTSERRTTGHSCSGVRP